MKKSLSVLLAVMLVLSLMLSACTDGGKKTVQETATAVVATVEEKVEKVTDKVEETVSDASEKVEEAASGVVEAVTDKVEEVTDKVEEVTEDVVEAVTDKVEEATDKVEEVTADVVEEATDKVEEATDKVEEVTADVVEEATDKVEEATDKVEEVTADVVEEATDKVEEVTDKVEEVTADVVEEATDKVEEVTDQVEEVTADVVEEVTDTVEEVTAEVVEETEAKTVRIALVTDTGGINDQSFNASAWQGMEKARDELGAEIKYFESKTDADYEPNLVTAVDDGYDLIIAVGWMMADQLSEVAAEYPEQKFAIIDNGSVGDNVVGINFATEQCSYLVGVIAATMTETKNVGFVVGMVSPLMDTFGVGYYAGVLDTCPDCTIQEFNANSYGDVAGGKAAALNMFTNGADVVYHAAGGTGLGVIEAAAEQGKYAIGVDQDQAALGLGEGHVLTAALKNVGNAVYALAEDLVAGNFAAGDKMYDLKTGAVDYASSEANVLSDAAKEAAEAAKAAILAGDIVVAPDREGYNAKYGDIKAYTLE